MNISDMVECVRHDMPDVAERLDQAERIEADWTDQVFTIISSETRLPNWLTAMDVYRLGAVLDEITALEGWRVQLATADSLQSELAKALDDGGYSLFSFYVREAVEVYEDGDVIHLNLPRGDDRLPVIRRDDVYFPLRDAVRRVLRQPSCKLKVGSAFPRPAALQELSHKEQHARYLRSKEWRIRRNMVLEFWGQRCCVCNGGLDLRVHHRTYVRWGNERLQDLPVLCEGCHTIFHQHGRLKGDAE